MEEAHVARLLFATKKNRQVEAPLPLAPIADTHGHLTSLRRRDPAEAIARAALAGVRLLVVPVDPSDDVDDVPAFLSWLDQTVEQAQTILGNAANEGNVPPRFAGWEAIPDLVDNVYYVAGVHPYGSQRFLEDASVRSRLEVLLSNRRCLGVGEFGLDYGPWSELPSDLQMKAFRMQLRIAHERSMPVELHLRDGKDNTLAHQHALHVLQEEGVPVAGCDLHCFTSGPDVMRPFVDMGCRIAFGGAVTFANSDDIRSAAVACPDSLLLSETDSPYMSPVPLRGLECEPAMVVFSAACVAEEREREGVATRKQTYESLWRNANEFFGLS